MCFPVLFSACVLFLSCSAPEEHTHVIEEDGEMLTGMGGYELSRPMEQDMILETVRESVPELFYTGYEVRRGDMIGVIAQTYGITQDTLISVNNIKNTRTLQIGQFIKIPSIAGILYTTKKDNETPAGIAEKYEISAEKTASVNNISEDAALPQGTTLFLPDAELDWVTRQEINGDLFMRPIKRSYYLSSYFGWRSSPFTSARTYHNGVDMATPYGTSVYASLGGTVAASGWDNTYGNYVIIRHHSGYQTLYGHMSKRSVSYGQYVSAGQKIGEVGSTGLSTGAHLHFTIYKNGKAINPLNLWH